ncbi:MAG: hypothetical protein AB7O73_04550 [Bacteroidia bacterium]
MSSFKFKKKKQEHVVKNKNNFNEEIQPTTDEINKLSDQDKTVYVSIDNVHSISRKKPLIITGDTCGDRILFKNGNRELAKVISIDEKKIIYKKCDNINGPTYTIGKEKVHSITYVNGFSEIIEPPAYEPKPAEREPAKKHYPDQLMWAYVLFFILNGIGVPFSLYFGLKAKKEIQKYPNHYKGIKLTRFIIFLNILVIVAFALMLAVMLSNPYGLEAILLVALGFILALIIGSIVIFTSK